MDAVTCFVEKLGVVSVAGDEFSGEDNARLAYLVWCRWGPDDAGAASAWRRLLGTTCSDSEYMLLVRAGARLLKRESADGRGV